MLRAFQLFSSLQKRPPDVVFVEVVDMLHKTFVPPCVSGLTNAAIGFFVAAREGDRVIFGLTVVSVMVTFFRICEILAFRHCWRIKGTLSIQKAIFWDKLLSLGTLASLIMLGVVGARGISWGDPLMSMLISGLLFGCAADLISRTAMRPAVTWISLLLAIGPIIVSFGMEMVHSKVLSDEQAYLAEMLLISIFTVAGIEIVLHGHATIVQMLLAKKELANLAAQDVLTGLPNRSRLRSEFSKGIMHSEETGKLLAVHCLDLDRFKAVNDTFGHPIGDALLKAVAGRLTGVLRDGDTAVRLGGDEFVIMQAGVCHVDETRLLAQRIVRTISAPYELEGHVVDVGVSIGIALFPGDSSNLEEVISHADAALYKAKREKRGSVVLWSEVLSPAETKTPPEPKMTAGAAG